MAYDPNKKPINQYDGLLGIGGDGTLNEIINGMLKRKPKKNLMRNFIKIKTLRKGMKFQNKN